MHFMSGRALFTINPDLFEDAEDAGVDDIIFEDDEERKDGERDDDSEEEKRDSDDDDNEERKDAAGAARVKVDQNLFADEGAAADEDVDFD